ncbi:MAG TPA: D-alanyl-D-alanine carboxypeptidase [Cyanothece sp. UBA12306]|nr:D-alanyl-D-alanine carboxypeptidase [Cyanothece sp. UBA12306]
MHEIPEALREASTTQPTLKPKTGLLMIGGLGMGLMVVMGVWFLVRPSAETAQTNPVSATAVTTPPKPTPEPVLGPAPEPIENLLGHLPYQEAPVSQLKPITNNGQIKLRLGAAEQFLAMQKAARSQGIILVPISGFRTLKQQNYLFFEIKRQRNQNASTRAEVSAPPHYSEHHTGYAVDIGDGRTPATNLSQSFEKTAAFRWLKNNAAKYSFELSFPPNNPQGISYEPWHWRYVGDQESLETFYKAKQLLETSSN